MTGIFSPSSKTMRGGSAASRLSTQSRLDLRKFNARGRGVRGGRTSSTASLCASMRSASRRARRLTRTRIGTLPVGCESCVGSEVREGAAAVILRKYPDRAGSSKWAKSLKKRAPNRVILVNLAGFPALFFPLLRAPRDERRSVAVAPAVFRRGVVGIERRHRYGKLDRHRLRHLRHGAQILAHAVDVETDIGRAAFERGDELGRAIPERVGAARALLHDLDELRR